MGDYEDALKRLAEIEGPLQRHALDAAGKRSAREAEAALRRAIEDPAARGPALVRLAGLLRWLGDLEEAEERFDDALRLPPGEPAWREAVLGKAELLMMQARHLPAIELLRLGLERRAEDADLRSLLGTCLYYQGDVDGAARELERAPAHAEAVALLRMIRRDRARPPEPGRPRDREAEARRLDRALEIALEALRKGPGTPEEKAAGEARLREVHRRKKGSP